MAAFKISQTHGVQIKQQNLSEISRQCVHAELISYHQYNYGRLTSIKIQRTVHLETTDGLDFKTPKFPHHVIDSRYRLDEGNLYMQKKLKT